MRNGATAELRGCAGLPSDFFLVTGVAAVFTAACSVSVQKAFNTFAMMCSPVILFDVSMEASLHNVRKCSIGVNPIPLWDYADNCVRLKVLSARISQGALRAAAGEGGQYSFGAGAAEAAPGRGVSQSGSA